MSNYNLYRLFQEFQKDEEFKNEFFLTEPSYSIASRVHAVKLRFEDGDFQRISDHIDYVFVELYGLNVLAKIDLGSVFDEYNSTDFFIEVPGISGLILQYELNPVGLTDIEINKEPFDEDEEFCVLNWQTGIDPYYL